jgi:predicted enzyme related to lactoylglutathione lyase
MTLRTSPWPPGVPCWADLATPDVATAKAFYGAVLGWQYQDTEAEYGGYAIAEVDGGPAAGIGPMPPDTDSAWTVYLASDDADQTSAEVAEHGGTVVLAPGDVGDLGRMGVATDPSGGTFGVWEAGTHVGAAAVNRPGGLTWEDLRSTDPDAARAFYEALFGYRTEPIPDGPPDYTTFALPDEEHPLGGMGGMIGVEDLPSHWVVYFGVEDAGAAEAAAEANGGTVLLRDLESPYGRMAELADPADAVFWIIEASADTQPDRSG